jgi:hypothetical protein
MVDQRWKDVRWGIRGGVQFAIFLSCVAAIPAVIAEIISRGSGGARNFVVAVPIYLTAGVLAGGLVGLWRQHLHRRKVAVLIGALVGPPIGLATGLLLGKLDDDGGVVVFLMIGLVLGIIFAHAIWSEEWTKRW